MLVFIFIVVGIALFAGSIVTKLQMEKEVKGGRKQLSHNLFPYFNSDDFSEKGNSLRKKYNLIYYALIVYSITLYIFMKSGD